jgi:hypothetical protein
MFICGVFSRINKESEHAHKNQELFTTGNGIINRLDTGYFLNVYRYS